MRRFRWTVLSGLVDLLVAVAALLALATVFEPAAFASSRSHTPAEQLTATPNLYPSFRPSVHDYVLRGSVRGPLKLDIDTSVRQGTVTVTARRRVWRGGRVQLSLRADQELTVTFDRSGRAESYYIRALPYDFPAFTFTARARLPDVYYLTAPTLSFIDNSYYVIVFDRDGVPVWWMKSYVPYDQQAFSDHTIGWWTPAAANGASGFVVHDLSGRVAHTWQTPNGWTDLHEFQLLPNGDALLSTDLPRPGTVNLSPYGGPATGATLVDPVIDEVSHTGRLVWSWSAQNYFGAQDTVPAAWPSVFGSGQTKLADGRVAYDYSHLNSIQQLPDGKTLIVSFADLSAVFAIDKRTGRVLWKLGGTPSAVSLKVIGDPQGQQPFSDQHYARMLPDGTLTVYDDNTWDGFRPRAARYRIDPRKMTATLIDQQTDPLITSSGCCGSAALERNGSWLVSWGDTPLISAFSRSGKSLFALAFAQDYFSYRVQQVPASWLPISELRTGMNRMVGSAHSSPAKKPPVGGGYTRRRAARSPLSYSP